MSSASIEAGKAAFLRQAMQLAQHVDSHGALLDRVVKLSVERCPGIRSSASISTET